MGAVEPIHILIVLIVVLLLFGAKRLPELGKSLGSGIREFKKSTQELHGPVEEEPRAAMSVASPAQLESGTPQASADDVSASGPDS
jgi:sec-independent protein translocase protein TatA